MGRFVEILLPVTGTVALQVMAQAVLLANVRFIDRRTRGRTELQRTFWISLGAVAPLFFGHLAQVGLWAGFLVLCRARACAAMFDGVRIQKTSSGDRMPTGLELGADLLRDCGDSLWVAELCSPIQLQLVAAVARQYVNVKMRHRPPPGPFAWTSFSPTGEASD